ncbi:hypothetical protein OIU78_005734 [Salix suchowensis]|nr:hypothetical protein OIU78_005734 [Salix suchowensis]
MRIKAIKNRASWQILRGLHYLRTHEPPIIHGDLRRDNIFVNGNNGEVKIGDLGLAIVMQRPSEMVTREYPCCESKNPGQIYKNIISGVKPTSLDKPRRCFEQLELSPEDAAYSAELIDALVINEAGSWLENFMWKHREYCT